MTKERDKIVFRASHRSGIWAVSVLQKLAQTMLSTKFKECTTEKEKDERAEMVLEQLHRILTPEQINIDEAYIDIRVAKNRSSVRQIPIHSNVLSVFANYKEQGCNLYGCTHDGLNKALKQFCGLTAHCCRHTFTSRMHECGCNPLVLQLLLGHTPQSITEKVYTHISLKELRDNLELLDYCIN